MKTNKIGSAYDGIPASVIQKYMKRSKPKRLSPLVARMPGIPRAQQRAIRRAMQAAQQAPPLRDYVLKSRAMGMSTAPTLNGLYYTSEVQPQMWGRSAVSPIGFGGGGGAMASLPNSAQDWASVITWDENTPL